LIERLIVLPLVLTALSSGTSFAQQSQGSGVQQQRFERDPELPRVELHSEASGLRGSGGFIASLPLAQNATVGFGRFIAQPRKPVSVQDQPVTLAPKRNRRAAIGLSLRF
jgi:hypothetical protein